MNREKLLEIAENKNEAVYVYDLSVVEQRYKQLVSGISYKPLSIHYAIKANWHPQILQRLLSLGSGIECVSPGEVKAALDAGFTPEQIMFTCSSLSREELEGIINLGIQINLDSINQLKWFGEINPGGKASLRVNHDVGDGHHAHVITGGAHSKFGIHWTHLSQAKEIAKEYKVSINGLHQHIGSHILDEHIFVGAMNILLETAKEFEDLEFVDFGGGFGVPYHPEDRSLDMEKLGDLISETFKDFCGNYGKNLRLVFEPGRYLVAEAGTLLATVTDIKEQPGRTFVGVNSGFNQLVRPTMYDSYHHIENLTSPDQEEIVVTVVGNICESGDIFALDRNISSPKIGDKLAIKTAGAYGYSMSSDYNRRSRPQEIIIE